jgi:hypothetical protein
MKHACPGRSMTRYVILGIITFMISGVTSAQIIMAEQQSDSAPWLLDKTAKPLAGGKAETKTPEPPPADARGKHEAKAPERMRADADRKEEAKAPERMPPAKSASSAGQEVSADSSSSSGWLPPSRGYGSCRHSAPDQEDFLCTLGRILFGSTPSGPNRDMDENISAGGAGG